MSDLKEKASVRNLAPWVVSFRRKFTTGDVVIPPKGRVTLTTEEIMAQVYDKNKLFVGTDGYGAHARIYIEDKDVRIAADFETEDGSRKQKVLFKEGVQEIFDLKTLASFKKNIKDKVVSDAEKYLLVDMVKELKLNDYAKIKFIEEFTGYKLD